MQLATALMLRSSLLFAGCSALWIAPPADYSLYSDEWVRHSLPSKPPQWCKTTSNLPALSRSTPAAHNRDKQKPSSVLKRKCCKSCSEIPTNKWFYNTWIDSTSDRNDSSLLINVCVKFNSHHHTDSISDVCILNWHFLRRSSPRSDWDGRIWPFRDLFGIFPYDIILTEDEQRAVNSEAVLFDWYRVVNGHGPGSLGHRLFVHPMAPRRPRLPAGPSGWTRGTDAAIAAGQFIFKASHCGIAQIFLEKAKLKEKKWRRSITTRTVVPSSRSSAARLVHDRRSQTFNESLWFSSRHRAQSS